MSAFGAASILLATLAAAAGAGVPAEIAVCLAPGETLTAKQVEMVRSVVSGSVRETFASIRFECSAPSVRVAFVTGLPEPHPPDAIAAFRRGYGVSEILVFMDAIRAIPGSRLDKVLAQAIGNALLHEIRHLICGAGHSEVGVDRSRVNPGAFGAPAGALRSCREEMGSTGECKVGGLGFASGPRH